MGAQNSFSEGNKTLSASISVYVSKTIILLDDKMKNFIPMMIILISVASPAFSQDVPVERSDDDKFDLLADAMKILVVSNTSLGKKVDKGNEGIDRLNEKMDLLIEAVKNGTALSPEKKVEPEPEEHDHDHEND